VPIVRACPHTPAQSERIAQILNQDYGTATITHPFHPLHGKSFPILKVRKFPSENRFSLLAEGDVFSVPESWILPVREDGSDKSPFNTEVLRNLLDLTHFFEESVDKGMF